MKLSAHIEALLTDLNEIAAVGGDATSEAARRLTAALRTSANLRMLGAVNEAALEISAQLPSGHVEVRLAGGETAFVYTETPANREIPVGDDGVSARISLRLPESLKEAIEEGASREGLSVNAWLVRALTRAVASPPSRRGPGSRLTGYARS